MKEKNRLLAGILSAALIFSSIPEGTAFIPVSITASAETGIYENELLYSVESGSVSITGSLDDSLEELVIPSEIDGMPVVRITGSAFTNSVSLRTVYVPGSVSEIESGAFARCMNLIAIDVSPDNAAYSSYGGILLDKHGSCLLRCPGGISDEDFALPETVTTIAYGAFQSCINIREIVIPDTVYVISNDAFSGCTALERIVFPNGIHRIDVNICSGCTSLKEAVFPETVKIIAEDAFYGCSSLESVSLPEGLESICAGAFINCASLKSITIPEGIKILDEHCFFGCRSLESVKLPQSLEKIGSCCFMGCTALADIEFPEGLCEIGNNAFRNCTELKEINLPLSIKKVTGAAFFMCTSLENVFVPSENEYYASPDGILFSRDMTEIIYFPSQKPCAKYVVPESVKFIRKSAFAYCEGLEELVIPDNVAAAEANAFMCNQSLNSVSIGKNLKAISENMFAGCTKLRSISIPSNIETICSGAFSGCTNLSSVEINEGVQFILSGAFLDCGLTSINIPKSVFAIGGMAFGFTENENGELVPLSKFVISGYTYGASEEYALNNGFPFVALGQPDVTTTVSEQPVGTTGTTVTTTVTGGTVSPAYKPGDVDCNGFIEISDVTIILRYYAKKGADIDVTFADLIAEIGGNHYNYIDEETCFRLADMDENNHISLSDAVAVLKIYAIQGAG